MTTKAQDRKHAETYRSPFGRWDLTAPTYMASPAVVEAPLRAVSAAYAAGLRASHTPVPPRPGREERAAATQARVRAAIGTPAVQALPGTPVVANKADLYAKADALAARAPVGRYALRRDVPTADGNDITFFEVVEFKSGPRKGVRRIFQIISNGSGFTQMRLPVEHQIFALGHILADVASAAGLFGRTLEICAFGPHPLTNTRSRAAGYGETCAKNHNLPW